MTFSQLLASNILVSPNITNLALFICYLLIAGQFRTGHILFDPSQFNPQFTVEFQLNCPKSIPWLMTDVTKSFSSPWQPFENTDHILQLAFFDQYHLPEPAEGWNDIFTYYRVFVVSRTDQNIETNQVERFKGLSPSRDDNLLVLNYNSLVGSIWIHRLNENIFFKKNDIITKIDDQTSHLDENQLFLVNSWSISIEYMITYPRRDFLTKYNLDEVWIGTTFYANYYLTSLNAAFINRKRYFHNKKGNTSQDIQIVNHLKHEKVYADLTTDYSELNDKSQ